MKAKEYGEKFLESYNKLLDQKRKEEITISPDSANFIVEEMATKTAETLKAFSEEMLAQYEKHPTRSYFSTCWNEACQKWAAMARYVNKKIGFEYLKPNGFKNFWESANPGMSLFSKVNIIKREGINNEKTF